MRNSVAEWDKRIVGSRMGFSRIALQMEHQALLAVADGYMEEAIQLLIGAAEHWRARGDLPLSLDDLVAARRLKAVMDRRTRRKTREPSGDGPVASRTFRGLTPVKGLWGLAVVCR